MNKSGLSLRDMLDQVPQQLEMSHVSYRPLQGLIRPIESHPSPAISSPGRRHLVRKRAIVPEIVYHFDLAY